MKSAVLLIAFFFLNPAQGSPKPIRVVFLGDSLTDGYGVARENAYPALIEARLHAEGYPQVKIQNSSISGSTTASAVSRLKWHLKERPDILVLALGANDGLRGLNLKDSKKALTQAIELAKKEKIAVLLAGMKIPPNYGKKYSDDFESLFITLARSQKVDRIPFLLEGVGGEPELNLPDGIHPNERGHERMAKNVYPHLLKLIRKVIGS